jgi:hypothetical protein
MKRFAILSAIALCLAILTPAALGQENPDPHKDLINHGNLGLYFDLTRLANTQLNMFGVGGRIGFNVQRHIVLEGEMAYDFEQSKSQTLTSGGSTNVGPTCVCCTSCSDPRSRRPVQCGSLHCSKAGW